MFSHKKLLCLFVAAQAMATAVPAVSEDSTALEEVIVTATKRSESLQDVAMAVTAISGDDMASKGIFNIQGIALQVPSVNWGEHFGTTLVSIRGVGSIVDSGVTEPTVALYVDGVFLPRSTMATLRAVDLERVEVLRGPQGTLYGRNATGGAINFVSSAPTKEFSSRINLGAGSRDGYEVSGFVSGPLGDGIYGRLSGGHEEQDGYVDVNEKPVLGGVDVDYIRGALRIEATEAVTVDLTARYEKNTAANAFQQYFTNSLIAPPSLYTTKPNKIIADRPYSQQSETLVLAATLNWQISNELSLKSITSYVDHKSNAEVDSDGTGADFNYVPSYDGGFDRPSESYGQEFNLVGDFDSVDWLLGAFVYNEDARNSLPVTLGAVAVGQAAAGMTIYMPVKSKTDSWALFGDLTWSLTDRLRLNLGGRFNNEKQDFVQTWGLVLPTSAGVVNIVAPISVKLDDENKDFLPKVGLQFDVAENVNAYVQWSKGYKSGGANIAGGGGENLGQLYKPENIDAFEAGLKTQWLGGALTWNSAAFYYDYKDMQVTRNAPPAVTVVDNSDAEVYGFESEATWSVTDNFHLNGALVLLHSRFKDYMAYNSVTGTIDDLDGTPVPHAPDYTMTIGADYTIKIGGALVDTLTLSGTVYHTDDVVLRQFAGDDNIQKAYTLGNLSATLANPDSSLRLTAFVNNVGDKEYKQHVLHWGVGYMGNYAPPRTWGLRLSKDF